MVDKKNDDSYTVPSELMDVNEREHYLIIMNDAINYLHHKAVNGKVRDAKKEKVKIDYFRALIYAVNTANSIYKDKQIDDMAADIELLKNAIIYDDNYDDESADEINDENIKELINYDEKLKEIKNTGG